MEIDLVYLWVDGNDPVWQAKHNAYTNKSEATTDIDCKGRYSDNDELKYSLRSIEMYAPWIRKIFIVTDNQIPTWLNSSNPKVRIIDHREIMPDVCLPCFNSTLIERYIYKIPGLAEHFIYANDDMFVNKPISESDLFTPEGFPIVRLIRKPFRRLRWFWKKHIRKKTLNNYRTKIELASQFVYRKYGKYYTGIPHHNIDAYLKSDYTRVAEEVMHEEFQSSMRHKVRNDNDIQRVAFSYIALAENHGQRRYVTKKESMYIGINRKNFYREFDKYQPLFFCMNDSELADDDNRETVKAFLERRFPDKSVYEK